MRGCFYAIVHCFRLVIVTLLLLRTMETANGEDTLHINNGRSQWTADILVGFMFLLAACATSHHPLWSKASHCRKSHWDFCHVTVISSYIRSYPNGWNFISNLCQGECEITPNRSGKTFSKSECHHCRWLLLSHLQPVLRDEGGLLFTFEY